jgi:hypothetical protein
MGWLRLHVAILALMHGLGRALPAADEVIGAA